MLSLLSINMRRLYFNVKRKIYQKIWEFFLDKYNYLLIFRKIQKFIGEVFSEHRKLGLIILFFIVGILGI